MEMCRFIARSKQHKNSAKKHDFQSDYSDYFYTTDRAAIYIDEELKLDESRALLLSIYYKDPPFLVSRLHTTLLIMLN